MNWALKAVENFGRQRCGGRGHAKGRHSPGQRCGGLKAEKKADLGRTASGSGVEEQYDSPLPPPAGPDCSVAHGSVNWLPPLMPCQELIVFTMA